MAVARSQRPAGVIGAGGASQFRELRYGSFGRSRPGIVEPARETGVGSDHPGQVCGERNALSPSDGETSPAARAYVEVKFLTKYRLTVVFSYLQETQNNLAPAVLALHLTSHRQVFHGPSEGQAMSLCGQNRRSTCLCCCCAGVCSGTGRPLI